MYELRLKILLEGSRYLGSEGLKGNLIKNVRADQVLLVIVQVTILKSVILLLDDVGTRAAQQAWHQRRPIGSGHWSLRQQSDPQINTI